METQVVDLETFYLLLLLLGRILFIMNKLIGAIGQGQFTGILTPLLNRKLIHLYGADTFTFLHGLVTCKIITRDESFHSGATCDYGAFLNDKGRILSEGLFYHRPSAHSFWIETDLSSLENLKSHLEKYKMRKKVFFDETETNKSYKIYSLLCTNEENQKNLTLWLLNTCTQLEINFYQDPRWPLALRIIAPFDSSGINLILIKKNPTFFQLKICYLPLVIFSLIMTKNYIIGLGLLME